MDQNIEQSIAPQMFHQAKSYQLTQFPVGNLVNPGIAGTFQNFDFSIPMYGKTDVKNVEKSVAAIPGSVPEESNNFSQNTSGEQKPEKALIANQGGFGNKKEKDAIFKAMQTPTIKINKIAYVPKAKLDKKRKTIKKQHKMKLV